MKICHISEEIPARASFRYRVLLPGKVLADMGHEIGVSRTPEPDASNVYHKHADLHEQKMTKCPGVLDITDDHWRTDAPLWTADRANLYTRLAEMAAAITCSSAELRDVIDRWTGRDAFFVRDPYEFDEVPHRWFGVESVLWFGHSSNFRALRGIELDCPIEVVTDCQPGAEGNVRMTPWSLQGLRDAFARHDTVIIPQLPHGRAKNANRAIAALRQGKFVIATPTPAIEELSDWVFVTDDILAGIQWARAHPDEVATMVAAGQAHVAAEFSPERAASEWLWVLESV